MSSIMRAINRADQETTPEDAVARLAMADHVTGLCGATSSMTGEAYADCNFRVGHEKMAARVWYVLTTGDTDYDRVKAVKPVRLWK